MYSLAVSAVQARRSARMRFIGGFALTAAAGLACGRPAAAAPVETVLYSFKGVTDGVSPQAGLIFYKGALYGTTQKGGSPSSSTSPGTVFKLTPPAAGKPDWTEAVLYSFMGSSDGQHPLAGLVADGTGTLYGTTPERGSSGHGVVFKLSPPATGKTQWTQTVLYSFTGGSDGGDPSAGLILDVNGALYGTTYGGGHFGSGVVFKLTPPAAGKTQWTQTVLYRFNGQPDGRHPYAGLILDARGALYGTTVHGGTTSNLGTVFKLTPPAAAGKPWTKSVLYRFNGGNDGAYPYAGLTFDGKGALYGTTSKGGTSNNYGTVFKLTPPAAGKTQWTGTVLYSFKGRPDGATPYAGVVFDSNKSALYGTTYSGGSASRPNVGTLFKLTPPAAGKTQWTETVLYSFKAYPDGDGPAAGLIFDASGVLYGTTFSGGSYVKGTVFKLKQ